MTVTYRGTNIEYFIDCDRKKRFAVILICIWRLLQEPGINAKNLAELTRQRNDIHIITSNWSYTLERAGAKNVINTKKSEIKKDKNGNVLIHLGIPNEDFPASPDESNFVLVILGSRLRREDFGTYFWGYVDLAKIRIIVTIDDLDYRRIIYDTYGKRVDFPYWKVVCNVEDFIIAAMPR